MNDAGRHARMTRQEKAARTFPVEGAGRRPPGAASLDASAGEKQANRWSIPSARRIGPTGTTVS